MDGYNARTAPIYDAWDWRINVPFRCIPLFTGQIRDVIADYDGKISTNYGGRRPVLVNIPGFLGAMDNYRKRNKDVWEKSREIFEPARDALMGHMESHTKLPRLITSYVQLEMVAERELSQADLDILRNDTVLTVFDCERIMTGFDGKGRKHFEGSIQSGKVSYAGDSKILGYDAFLRNNIHAIRLHDYAMAGGRSKVLLDFHEVLEEKFFTANEKAIYPVTEDLQQSVKAEDESLEDMVIYPDVEALKLLMRKANIKTHPDYLALKRRVAAAEKKLSDSLKKDRLYAELKMAYDALCGQVLESAELVESLRSRYPEIYSFMTEDQQKRDERS